MKGSIRGSGMVRGSTGMGPAGAGGKASKQGGDGQQRSVQNRFQFNPNIFSPPTTPPKTSLAIPNLGLQFSNPSIGSPQGIANLGTVNTGAGFNFGGDGAGKQGGLNQTFTPQVGPAPTVNIPAAPPQGIDTLQTSSPSFGPFQNINTLQQLQALDYLGFYGENPFADMDLSAYEGNMKLQDILREIPAVRTAEDLYNTITDPQIETGFGTIGLDLLDQNINLDTGNATINLDLKDDPFLGIKVPLGPQSSLVNPEDTSGIMQMADASQATINQIQQMKAAGLDEDFAKDQFIGTEVTPEEVEGIYRGTITSPTGQYSII